MRKKHKTIVKTCLAIGILIFSFSCKNEKKQDAETTKKEVGVDQAALDLLQRMSDNMKIIKSKAFTLSVSDDVLDENGKKKTFHNENVIKAVAPNKLFITLSGEKNRTYIFDGSLFTYYNKDENNFIAIEIEGSTMDMIHDIHENFDIDFPAGDFFYASLKGDLKNSFPSIQLSKSEKIDDELCQHILAQNEKMNIDIWVSEKTILPKRLKILNKDGNLNYIATFSNWKLNIPIEDDVFTFNPPADARLISIMPKS